MIVRPRPSALGLLFIKRGSIIPIVLPKLLCILVRSCAIGWVHSRGWFDPGHLSAVPFSSTERIGLPEATEVIENWISPKVVP